MNAPCCHVIQLTNGRPCTSCRDAGSGLMNDRFAMRMCASVASRLVAVLGLIAGVGPAIRTGDDFVERAARQMLPGDVRGSLQGQALTFRETVSSLTILMVLAVFVMYVILAILYESYLHPITVLSS